MLSVRTLVNGSLSQRLVKDTNAPYKNKKLEFTSSSIFAPTERMTLNVESLGEPTQSSDLQNNQCAIISTIQLKAGHKKDASLTDTDKQIEDLNKAIWYIQDEIKRITEFNDKTKV